MTDGHLFNNISLGGRGGTVSSHLFRGTFFQLFQIFIFFNFWGFLVLLCNSKSGRDFDSVAALEPSVMFLSISEREFSLETRNEGTDLCPLPLVIKP